MCPVLSSKAPNPSVDSKMGWNHGPSAQESQHSRSALRTTTPHQQVLPENANAPRIYFSNPAVIFFFSIWQSSSCGPWVPGRWQVPVCACRFLRGSWLLWRKDVMKRWGGVRGWGLYLSHQKQAKYMENTFMFQKESSWGTGLATEELGSQKEVPVPGARVIFIL